HPNRTKALRVLRGVRGPLDEARAARLLELYGVPRPKERTVDTPEQAARGARVIGFPVAVKAVAPEIPHKARLGGVRLGLATPEQVEAAAADVLRAAKRAGAKRPKVLVQRMVPGAEVLVGAVLDERFGAAVTVRPGGAVAEVGEATFVAAPLSRKQAVRFVEEQAAGCRLDPDVHDLHAVARVVEAVARAAHDLRGRLVSLEANPLMVTRRGAIAVDALAEARPPA
ncbi:MAG: acetate--CoA ligase family protein, partial [Actinomycetota bacterium]